MDCEIGENRAMTRLEKIKNLAQDATRHAKKMKDLRFWGEYYQGSVGSHIRWLISEVERLALRVKELEESK